jgi:excisionase family DNA binding protein
MAEMEIPMRTKEAAPAGVRIRASGQRQALDLYQRIQQSRARLVGPDGRRRSLPASLQEFLLEVIAGLGQAQSVAIVQDEAQLTTVEAARMLGVSRQFLIKLLERDEIPFHTVGAHRRVYVRDLLAYKAKRDSRRRQVLDKLTRAEAEDGLYGLEPPDDAVD